MGAAVGIKVHNMTCFILNAESVICHWNSKYILKMVNIYELYINVVLTAEAI